MAGNSLFTMQRFVRSIGTLFMYEEKKTHDAQGHFLVAWFTVAHTIESPSRRNIIVCLLWNREAPPALFTVEEFVARCTAEMPPSRKKKEASKGYVHLRKISVSRDLDIFRLIRSSTR